MTGWTSDELAKIGTAQELQIASLCRDGSLRNPRTIGVVRVGDDLYVRSKVGPPTPQHVVEILNHPLDRAAHLAPAGCLPDLGPDRSHGTV